jgi:hypothetical protein
MNVIMVILSDDIKSIWRAHSASAEFCLILDPINSPQRVEISSISSNLKKAHTREAGSLKI